MGQVISYYRNMSSVNRNSRWFLASYFVFQFGISIHSLFFNLYLLRLGYQEDFIGLLSAVFLVSMAVTAIPAGILSDRIGRRRALIMAGLAMIAWQTMKSFTASRGIILAAFVLDGATSSIFAAAANPFMFENSSEETRIHLFTLFNLSMLISGVMGNLVGGLLPGMLQGSPGNGEILAVYRTIFALTIVTLSFSAAMMFGLREGQARPTVRHQGVKGVLPPSTWPVIVQFLVTNALIAFGAQHFMPFMNTFFRRRLQATDGQIGFIFAAAQLTVAFGTVLAPVAAQRMGEIRAIVFFQSFAVPLLFTMAMAPNLLFAATAYALRNAFMQMVSPIRGPLALSMIPEKARGTANGILATGDSAARALGAVSAGVLISRYGYPSSFMVAAVTYAVSTALFWTYFRDLPTRRQALTQEGQ